MKIKFLGATGEVTGSSYCLSVGKTNLLIDFGLYQGANEKSGVNLERPELNFGSLKAVVLTHAHLDHCGRLPLLSRFGFHGPIFMTQATKALAELVLFDSAKLSKEEGAVVLYNDDDVITTLESVQIVEYDEEVDLGDLSFHLVDAGHILGSGSVVINEKVTNKIIAFSGDLGNTPEPLLHPTEFVTRADIAICESTYGDKMHGNEKASEEIAKIVQMAEKENSVVLIPSFSIERAQDLLYIFDQLKKQGKVKVETPVYLDSPMAIKATMVFKQYPTLLEKKLMKQAQTDDPFDFPGLNICDTMEKSRMIKNISGCKVIIAGSGMMSGGRILFHAANYLGDPKTHLVFVGYQAEGTMGREIFDGVSVLNIYGNTVEVKATLHNISSMSAHADQEQLMTWLKKINKLSKVILTHGEDIARLVLSEKIKNELDGVEVEIPKMNQEINIE